MADPNLIACLYPTGDRRSVESSLRMIHMAENSSRFIAPDAISSGNRSRDSSQSLEEEEDDNNNPDYVYSEGLQLKFDQPRKNRVGILIGTSPGCDIVIPKVDRLKSVGRYQCAITFDRQGRLILQDLREPGLKKDGTFVTYDNKGGFKRRRFTWILGGDQFTDIDQKTIVIAFHDKLQFQLVVPPHDFDSHLYKDKVAQFRHAVAEDVYNLPFQELDFQSLESSAAPSGAQTPSEEAILIDNGELGRGAQAVVTRVWNVSTGLEYASKEPLHQGYWDRLKREASLLEQTSHENIVRCIRALYHPAPQLVLEYIPLGTLCQQAKEKSLSAEETLRVLGQGLSALRHLHERQDPIAHRDIKPANILVQSRNPLHIKLSDFGYSNENQDYLATVCGTRYYAAPEVYGGHYDESVDIWSLGLLVLQYAHGLPPVDKGIFRPVVWAKKIIASLHTDLEAGYCPLLAFLSKAMLVGRPESRHSAYRCYQEACQLDTSQCCSSTPMPVVHRQKEEPTAILDPDEYEDDQDQTTPVARSPAMPATTSSPSASVDEHPSTSEEAGKPACSDAPSLESASTGNAKRGTNPGSKPSSSSRARGKRAKSTGGEFQRVSPSELRQFYEGFSNPLDPLYVGSSVALLNEDTGDPDSEEDRSPRSAPATAAVEDKEDTGSLREGWPQLQEPHLRLANADSVVRREGRAGGICTTSDEQTSLVVRNEEKPLTLYNVALPGRRTEGENTCGPRVYFACLECEKFSQFLRRHQVIYRMCFSWA